MKPPEFWRDPDALLGRLLSPLGWAYATATAWRMRRARSWRAPVPVICVGNLTAGGAGKTPVVRDLTARLTSRDWRPSILSRGYGGRAPGPLRVDPLRHDAADVGDEPLLLSSEAPCWVGADRTRTARAAVAEGAGVLVMDDGLQNPDLIQDLRLVVVDGPVGFGNGRPIPAGPLREHAGSGLARADALIMIGTDAHGLIRRIAGRLPVLRARLVLGDADRLAGERLVAFAGIGRPEKFRDSLIEAGADIAEFRPFPDHHPFTSPELEDLVAAARRLDAELVTTEKDWVRLSSLWRGRIRALPVRIVWRDETAVLGLLDLLRAYG
jgi:tetraacyldisaccharide 4'-kinase